MKPFKYHVPTPLYFGKNCLDLNAELICSLGKRAFIITSRFAEGCENLALADMKRILTAHGIEYAVNENVEENPPVESCVEIFKDAQKFNPDFLIGIGGGSAIDTAKAVNIQLEHPDMDTIELFFGGNGNLYNGDIKPEGLLPVIAVPTTAGTGADVTAAAVITWHEKKTKQSIKHRLYCTMSLVDPRYIMNSPAFLIHTGVFDALAHGVECYLNVNANFYSRSVAEIGFKLFREFKDNMLNDTLTEEDYEKMHLAASIASSAMMQSGTTLPHGLGYPLSQFHHINHGLSCSVTLGEYLKSFKDQSLVQPIIEMLGFKTSDELADYMAEIIKRDMKLEVTVDEINEWTDNFFETQQRRLTWNPEPVTKEDIRGIYMRSLKPYIVG